MRVIIVIFLLVFTYSCKPFVVRRPLEINYTAQDSLFTKEILSKSKNGYWIVVRGYSFLDHVVAAATISQFTHVAIIDIDSNFVIEAEPNKVHIRDLISLVHNAHKLTVVKPPYYTEESGEEALRFVKSKMGMKYDFLGTMGVNIKKRYYCGDLSTVCYTNIKDSVKLPLIIRPSYIVKLGKIVYITPNRKK